ncbi:dTDP-4-dehydrorhamnose reductase [Hylemonella gracilis]|uniref:dTDP-4-dehydrorhamnose reductase n=1 Tax=Hylemonella gracilis ATCC 19624 TaxID=887062 RepID=F3KSC4_9BURK|nr:dTDP-4-dehydrorhamnose reductase [Hylemonella gracilis]EGI77318.1 dTDP-4-dehydrorhamnose reductase [Hylemonella gracilis ATCC 19624]
MKILLFGKNGQVGWELQRSLAPLGEVIAVDRVGVDGLCGDLSDLDCLQRTVRAVQPQVIVNAAAYTAVDLAETDVAAAYRINAEAPGVLARAAAQHDALLVHYSTDYVFDGSGERPWREDDAPAPLSVYGRTKLEGEQAIRASSCRHLIFRTSWVYAARGDNFAKAMLRLAVEQDELRAINDQLGAPTGADLLADVTAHAIRWVVLANDGSAASGIYHLASAGEASWFDYARFVLAHAQQKGRVLKVAPQQVRAIPASAYPGSARRPHNSRLDCTRLRQTFGLALPPWQSGMTRMLDEIL